MSALRPAATATTATLKHSRRRLITRTLALAGGIAFLIGIWAGLPGANERGWRAQARKASHDADVVYTQAEANHTFYSLSDAQVEFHVLVEATQEYNFNADICGELSRRFKWKFWYVAGGLGLLAFFIRLKDWAW